MAKILSKVGIYPFAADVGVGPETLANFRTEILQSLDNMLEIILAPQNQMKSEKKANLAFHGHLWKAITLMDGYDQGIWGGANHHLDEAWDNLLAAQTLRDKYNFSRSVYFWKSKLVAQKGHRPLDVPQGEEIEAYHRAQADIWREIFKEIRPAPSPNSHAPAHPIHPVRRSSPIKTSGGRTDYTKELKGPSQDLAKALEEWDPVAGVAAAPVIPVPAGPAPVLGYVVPSPSLLAVDEEQPEGQGAQNPQEVLVLSSPSMPSSEDEAEEGGALMDGELMGDYLVEPEEDGEEETYSTPKGKGPLLKKTAKMFFSEEEESEDDEVRYTTPNGKGERKPVQKRPAQPVLGSDFGGESDEDEAGPSDKPARKKRGSELSPEDRETRNAHIMQLKEETDLTHQQIAVQVSEEMGINVTRAIVDSIIFKSGLSSKRELSPEMRQKRNARIIQLSKQTKMTRQEIADQVSEEIGIEVNRATVNTIISRGGLSSKKELSPEMRQKRNARIIQLRKQTKMTRQEIADQVSQEMGIHVTKYIVRNIIFYNGNKEQVE